MATIDGNNQNICFDGKLLAGTDRESVEYQTDVLRLLEKERLDSPSDACVPRSELPSSFYLNDLDPKNPEHIRNYLTHVPYFQTTACLRESGTYIADVRPPYDEIELQPSYVDPKKWSENPDSELQRIRKSTWVGTLSTAAYLLTEPDLSPAQMGSIYKHTASDSCSGFISADLFGRATDPKIKSAIADTAQYAYCDTTRKREQTAGDEKLIAEEDALLYPMLRYLYENDDRLGIQSFAMGLMLKAGGEEALEYVTAAIYDGKLTYSSLGGEYLVEAANHNFERALPYLDRMLKDRTESSKSARTEILKAMAEGRMPYDARLLPVLDEIVMLKRETGLDRSWNQAFLKYFVGCKSDAVPYLKSYALDKSGKLNLNFMGQAIAYLSWIDDQDGAGALKRIAIGNEKLEPTLERDAMEALVSSETKAAKKAVSEIMDQYGTLSDEHKRNLNSALDSANLPRDSAYDYFKRFDAMKADTATPSSYIDETKRAIAVKNAESFSRRFGDFNKEQQLYLMRTWLSEVNGFSIDSNMLASIAAYSSISSPLNTDADQKKEADRLVVNAFAGRLRERLGSVLQWIAFSTSVKERIIDEIPEKISFFGIGDLKCFTDAIDDPKVDKRLRERALLAMGRVRMKGVETVLRDRYILKADAEPFLRAAAAQALVERSKIPEYREESVAMMRSILPPPDDVVARFKKALSVAE